MSRPFQFYPEKAIEAVAFLLRRERGHRMNSMRLLKILYLAEREILAEAGTPLTGSTLVATQRGPVPDDLLDLIRGQHVATDQWAAHFQVDHYNLEMAADPGLKLLSRYVTRKLEEVATRYQDFDEWEMAEETRKLPEWKKNDPGTSSRKIPLEDVLEAVGRLDDLTTIVANARDDERARAFFAGAKVPATA